MRVWSLPRICESYIESGNLSGTVCECISSVVGIQASCVTWGPDASIICSHDCSVVMIENVLQKRKLSSDENVSSTSSSPSVVNDSAAFTNVLVSFVPSFECMYGKVAKYVKATFHLN